MTTSNNPVKGHQHQNQSLSLAHMFVSPREFSISFAELELCFLPLRLPNRRHLTRRRSPEALSSTRAETVLLCLPQRHGPLTYGKSFEGAG